jgi:hypothetical protein
MYICFLDSDDAYLPDHLSVFYDKLQSLEFPECLLFSNIVTGDDSFEKANACLNSGKYNPLERIFASLICLPQACIPRTVLSEHGFDENIHLGEDLELWSRIVVRYPVLFVDPRTVLVGEHEGRSIYQQEQRYRQNRSLAQRIFRSAPRHMQVSAGVRHEFLARCYYGEAKENMTGRRYLQAFIQLLKAFVLDPGAQTKHKLYLGAALIFSKRKAHQIIGPEK